MEQFIYNGKSSRQFGLHIRGHDTSSVPALKISQQYVPGRNGALLLSEEYYENRTLKYDVWAKVPQGKSKAEHERAIKNWLLASAGKYTFLEDSRDPMYLYMATYVSGMEFTTSYPSIIETTLTFTAKPFQYDRYGLNRITIQNEVSLLNPTPFVALPYFKIIGNGSITLGVNNQLFYLSNVNEYIEIDSEMMNVFKGIQNANTQMKGDGFPKLGAGNNGINWTGSVSKVEMEARWRAL